MTEKPGVVTRDKEPGIFSMLWRRWLRFAEIVGTVQMIIILTIIYWTILMLIALPFKILADPLRMRRSQPARWIERDSTPAKLDDMKKQF